MKLFNRVDPPQNNRNERRDYRECYYWAKGADLGCSRSISISEMLRNRNRSRDRFGTMRKVLGEAESLGFCTGAIFASMFYCSGCVVEKRDTKKAHELLSQAAESGYTPAMISIATLYTLESKTHTRVIETAPTNRFRDALTTSLIKLRDPKIVALTIYDEDLKKAMIWWRRAAKRGSRQAQYELALCFRDGRGVEVNLAKALYWMRQAAEAGLQKLN